MTTRLLIVLTFTLLILASLLLGAADLGAGRDGLWLLAVSRLPRTLAALLAGGGLAVAGLIMQMLARNRFAEPATVGTGQAAALGLVLITIFYPTVSVTGKMVVALATSLVATGAFLALIRRLPTHDPLMVPLTGIVYGGVLSALGGFIAYENDLIQYVGIWMNGEFSGVMLGRYEFLWLVGFATLVAYVYANRFTIAGMGEDMSLALGMNYRHILLIGLTIVSLVTAVTVVTVGMLPFVGLIVPNIASLIRGDNLRQTLPVLALSGAGLVLACDVIGRALWYPYEMPVGTILGVLGAAVFVWMIQRRPGHAA